jgi:hypothetical protein
MSFAEDIKKFAQKAGDNADLVVRKVVLDIGRSLVEKTPVGNPDLWQNPDNKPDGYVGGHARANWSHSIGALVNQEFKEIDATGGASIDRIISSVPVKAAGEVHYIQNSLPYMQALEDGHSTQAPAGMVAITQTEFQDYIQKALGELK